ncbi:MAG TPA: hypothetical protein ENH85_09485 [Candidatus Scalindua sp.]|nr:hypothetical protein [Candidatus Scalindua sp.]
MQEARLDMEVFLWIAGIRRIGEEMIQLILDAPHQLYYGKILYIQAECPKHVYVPTWTTLSFCGF